MDGRRPLISARHGLVAAAHPLAAQAGARLLANGGNAFDAAAATAAVLNVVEPFMSGLAGMGMATCFIAAEQRVRVLDFVTRVPGRFPTGRGEESSRGGFACGVPGCLAGWCELVKTHGQKKLMEVFAPAIALARDGHLVIDHPGATLLQAIAALRDFPCYADWCAAYLDEGSGEPGPGFIMRQSALARSLETIALEGPEYLYRGELGRRVVAHVEALGGSLTRQDLETARPHWLDPVAVEYRGLDLHAPPPPCEAFQFLLTLRLLDGVDFAGMERDGVEHLDAVWRAIRLAAGVRIAHNRPNATMLAGLLSEPQVAPLRARLREAAPVEGPTGPGWPQPEDPAKGHTTSFAVADRHGNVVCVTQSLGGLSGSGVVVPGTGICLGNFLFWSDLDAQGDQPLLPGTELTLPLAPVLALRQGRPVLALGTPGSHGISQFQTQVLVQHVDFGLDLQAAIEAPRARLWDGRRVQAERRIPPATLEVLRARGHDIEAVPDWSAKLGGMQGIAIDPASGVLTGGADPRREGLVAIP
ncbi:Gamma-glutamyltranspeptidase [Rhodovastum atsumiense]|uniref:Gamma-glutamyltranspeptidase n=1 Tax=Rhodovastum atsumiense TaxID=504468 RepID=A0A5M6IMN2_9PROT|nr:gamma-glutamyltransferase [Rhodovastum atsumiense]KAA5609119.1 gamma-glutamyltranspeptidase [Rhodovastum atsumiense]CAH2603797.1 Gamma-glutamyltranspeptidase [Rhodovastum atsumiense]